MRNCKNILVALLSLFSLTVKSQTNTDMLQIRDTLQVNHNVSLLGEPRKQLQTSFYSPELQIGDWLDANGVKQRKPTFFGIENEVETNGKTIVIDANEKATTKDISLKRTDNIVFDKDKVFVEKDNRLHQIPVEYSGDNTVNADNFSIKDKTKLSNYVIESFKFSGLTPSKIELKSLYNDYDLFIFKSSFLPNDILIKRVNMRTTHIFKLIEDSYCSLND